MVSINYRNLIRSVFEKVAVLCFGAPDKDSFVSELELRIHWARPALGTCLNTKNEQNAANRSGARETHTRIYRRSIKTLFHVQERRKCAHQSLSRLPILRVLFYFRGGKTSCAVLLRAMSP
jgi:hypothetical protein